MTADSTAARDRGARAAVDRDRGRRRRRRRRAGRRRPHRREWGRLDIAVCNAGGGLGSPAESKASTMDLDQFDAVLRRNLYGTVHTCVAVAPMMKEQGAGKIVTVSSQAGRRASGDGGYAHYGTAKAAIIMYTKYLAQDLGPHGIQVNCIAPGYIGTGRLMPMFEGGRRRAPDARAWPRAASGRPRTAPGSSASSPARSPTTSPARSSRSTAAARPDRPHPSVCCTGVFGAGGPLSEHSDARNTRMGQRRHS